MTITTVKDLETWLANERPDLGEAQRTAAAEALRASVHPAWGSDWGPWLADHHHVVDEAVE